MILDGDMETFIKQQRAPKLGEKKKDKNGDNTFSQLFRGCANWQVVRLVPAI